MLPLPPKRKDRAPAITISSTTMRSKSKPRRPIIDLSSVQPCSTPMYSDGNSTAFTRTTVGTSGSEGSGQRCYGERSAVGASGSHYSGSARSRGRSKSRPRDSDYLISSPKSFVSVSSRSCHSNHNINMNSSSSSRGRSHSRQKSRGRSTSVAIHHQHQSQRSSQRGRSLGPSMPRGRSSSRSRATSSSRSRIVSSSVSRESASSRTSAAASVRSSRSQSRARVHKSRKSSMETMEEEPEDANRSSGNVMNTNRYDDAARGREMATKEVTARGRGLSRGREVVRGRSHSRTNSVNVLQAVAAAAETNHRGKSLPRKRNDAATQAAMAAALNEVNRSKQNTSRSKSRSRKVNPSFQDIDAHLRKNKVKSRSFHDQKPMSQPPHQHPKTKSRSFYDHKPSPQQHQHTKAPRRSSQFSRKTSQSVSPPRSRSIARKSYTAASSVASSNSSASSTFSAYDRRIAENFNVAPTLATRDIQHTSSSEMALCEKGGIASTSNALLDRNGCCALHPFIQLRLLTDGKWRTLAKHCVVCREEASAGKAAIVTANTVVNKKLNHRRSSDSGARPKTIMQEKTRASVAIMEMCESGECSLTPSFLEADSDDDEPTTQGKNDDASSRGSVNSCVEHKATTSVAASSRVSRGISNSSPRELPPLEVSIPKMGTFDEEGSLKSKQSLDLHSLEQDDVKSVKSSGSVFKRNQVVEQDDVKSVRSTATWRRNHRAADQDDTKSVRSTATARRYHQTSEQDDAKSIKSSATARKKKSSAKTAIDMTLVDSVVESAIQKIKSMEEFQKTPPAAADPQVKSTVEAAAPISRMNPPPPPPPRTQSSKNLSSKTTAKPTTSLPGGNHNRSSNSSSLQRPPPPPPPPRSQMKTVNSVASSIGRATPTPPVTTADNAVDYGCSMHVLNPDPEPELQTDFDNDFDEMIPPFEQMEVSGIAPNEALNGTPGPVNTPAKDWMAYCITSSGREGKDTKGGKRRIFGRNSAKDAGNDREIIRSVRQMPFTDQFGDFGLYTGQVNEDGRPDGKGSMKYDNGVFYEGTWTNGGQDQKAAMQYERIRGGFTSWQGRGSAQTKSGSVLPWNARKNDTVDSNKKIHVRGMEWTDVNGDSGRYTGECNASELPHGHGVMKYDFGLIAEGEWNNGVLKENPHDRLMAAVTAPPMSSGRSIGPGMSVGPGAQGFSAASVGPMSVMGPAMGGAASVMGGGMSVGPAAIYPMQYAGVNPMMMTAPSPANAGQFTMVAQQNAMIKGQMGMYGGGSVYGGGSAYGGGSTYGGGSAYGQIPQAQMQGAQGQQPGQHSAQGPPISEIKIN